MFSESRETYLVFKINQKDERKNLKLELNASKLTSLQQWSISSVSVSVSFLTRFPNRSNNMRGILILKNGIGVRLHIARRGPGKIGTEPMLNLSLEERNLGGAMGADLPFDLNLKSLANKP